MSDDREAQEIIHSVPLFGDNLRRKTMPDDNSPQGEFDNITDIMAIKHLRFIKSAIALFDAGAPITQFRSLEYVGQFRAAMDFGSIGTPDAELVKASYHELMQRLKDYTNNNQWYQMLLKQIEEYIDHSIVPEVREDYFWRNGWGNQEDLIVQNMGKFYIPINVNGAFRIKHDNPNGEIEYLKRDDFLNLFEAKRFMITVPTKSGTSEKEVSFAQAFLKHNKTPPYMGLTFDPVQSGIRTIFLTCGKAGQLNQLRAMSRYFWTMCMISVLIGMIPTIHGVWLGALRFSKNRTSSRELP